MKTNKIMKYVLLLTGLLFFIGCNSDDDSSNQADFSGIWSGTFSGDDSGTWNVTIDQNGNVSGIANSTVFSQEYSILGTVTSNGVLTATLGTSSIGGKFTGNLNNENGSGVWINTIAEPDLSGTWSGVKQ